MDVMHTKLFLYLFWRPILVFLSILAVIITIVHVESLSPEAGHDQILRCGVTLALIALFWTTEALPLEVTSLLPLVILPLLGILKTDEVAKEYFSGANMLLLAACGVAGAAQHVNLHRRLALKVLVLSGAGKKSLLLSFMLVTTFLSFFICNTATCAMMIPILIVVLDQVYIDADPNKRSYEMYMFFLGIGYCANIGGTGTIAAEETNIIIMQVLGEFKNQDALTYATWMIYSLPIVLVILLFTYGWLLLIYNRNCERYCCDNDKNNQLNRFLQEKYSELGPMRFKEYAVAFYFISLVIIWFFAEPNFMEGWACFFTFADGGEGVSEATPAMFILVLIMLTPEHWNFYPFSSKTAFPPTIMDWKALSKSVPWGLLILRGAGFALAKASNESGLSEWIGLQMTGLSSLPAWAILTIILLMTSVLNEVVSNATTASILLPVLKNISIQLKLNPLYLMLPVVLSCNYTFMFPASSPTNAIVYKAGGMKNYHMVLTGLGVKIVAIIASLVAANTYGGPLLGMNEFPDWANSTINSTTDTLGMFLVDP